MRIADIDIEAASYEELQALIQSPDVPDEQKMFVILGRLDFFDWHKEETRRRFRAIGERGDSGTPYSIRAGAPSAYMRT